MYYGCICSGDLWAKSLSNTKRVLVAFLSQGAEHLFKKFEHSQILIFICCHIVTFNCNTWPYRVVQVLLRILFNSNSLFLISASLAFCTVDSILSPSLLRLHRVRGYCTNSVCQRWQPDLNANCYASNSDCDSSSMHIWLSTLLFCCHFDRWLHGF